MRKRLAILGGGVLIVTVILMAVYYQHRNAVSEGYDIKCVQPSEPTSAANSLTCKIYSSQNADQGKSKPPWWIVLLAWPEGITAWLLLLTLGAIVWQAWETRRAARAGQSAADVALAQIRMEKATERARLNIKVQKLQGIRMTNSKEGTTKWWLEAVLTLSNIGRGRAYFCNSAMRFIAMPFEASPPSFEEELAFSLDIGSGYFDPDDSPIRIKCTLEDCPNEIEPFLTKMGSTEMTVYLYGFVEYETMGMKWRYPFGYFWIPGSKDGAPPERWISDGFWDIHSKLNGTEYEMPEEQQHSNPN
jgi:hypothetical protein